MKSLKLIVFFMFMLAIVVPVITTKSVKGQATAITEAPTGFDNQTNGLVDQVTFDADKDVFAEQEFIADGLGPVYNAQSCGECHQSPVTGSGSQVTELRAGRFNGISFTDAAGGSLINDRAIHPSIQERVSDSDNVRDFRLSLSTLGDGFVEAIADSTLIAIAQRQPLQSGGLISGQVITVPVDEANGTTRVARFGWKNQHASLLSFSADAYLNEMGITTPIQPVENSSNGRSVAAFDTVADPEDDGVDLQIFTRFMRSTKAPSVDAQIAATPDAQAGSRIFDQIGCAICHVRDIVTAPAGTVINGGTFTVPPALGSKRIHPFGDFLLHNIGTGDGIVQNGGPLTRNKIRTAPLWGLRTRNRFLHNGSALTVNDAITRHGGEASVVTTFYSSLSSTQKNQLLTFLKSL